jgi:ketosteroid isomerase-like protein
MPSMSEGEPIHPTPSEASSDSGAKKFAPPVALGSRLPMRKKPPFRAFGLPLAAGILLTLAACSNDSEKFKAELLKADSAFCERAGKFGARAAFETAVTPDAKLLSQKEQGPEAVRGLFANIPIEARLTWSPEFADVSASGDLGYTWGYYTMTIPNAVGAPVKRTGTYVTIWRRQSDGSWKVVLDGGSPSD